MIRLVDSFIAEAGLPLDAKALHQNKAQALAAIPVPWRYQGLVIYLVDEKALYVFQDGTADSDLVPLTASSADDSLMRYKGSVANLAALLALTSNTLAVGDVYNLTDTDENYAYIGDGTTNTAADWDILGSSLDTQNLLMRDESLDSTSTALAAMDASTVTNANQFKIARSTDNPSEYYMMVPGIGAQRLFKANTDLGIYVNAAQVPVTHGGVKAGESFPAPGIPVDQLLTKILYPTVNPKITLTSDISGLQEYGHGITPKLTYTTTKGTYDLNSVTIPLIGYTETPVVPNGHSHQETAQTITDTTTYVAKCTDTEDNAASASHSIRFVQPIFHDSSATAVAFASGDVGNAATNKTLATSATYRLTFTQAGYFRIAIPNSIVAGRTVALFDQNNFRVTDGYDINSNVTIDTQYANGLSYTTLTKKQRAEISGPFDIIVKFE